MAFIVSIFVSISNALSPFRILLHRHLIMMNPIFKTNQLEAVAELSPISLTPTLGRAGSEIIKLYNGTDNNMDGNG